MFLIQDYIFIH